MELSLKSGPDDLDECIENDVDIIEAENRLLGWVFSVADRREALHCGKN